jgi:hypothetical protein
MPIDVCVGCERFLIIKLARFILVQDQSVHEMLAELRRNPSIGSLVCRWQTASRVFF